jgi:hypothetical protein
MLQEDFKVVSLDKVLRHPAFRVGMRDYREGKPFRYDFAGNVNAALQYEQGRHYAAGEWDIPDPAVVAPRRWRRKGAPKPNHPWN